jgi:hypothetical protein
MFNLSFFLKKRKISLSDWAKENSINSIEDFDNFFIKSEFSQDLSLRSEMEKELQKNKLINEPILVEETQPPKEVEVVDLVLKEEEVLEQNDKPLRKKRKSEAPVEE